MISNLFKRKKPLAKKNKPSKTKTSQIVKSSEKILTAEGWKRLMMRQKKVGKR